MKRTIQHTQIVCDRCGTYVSQDYRPKEWLSLVEQKAPWAQGASYDLCQGCRTDFLKWLAHGLPS